MLNAIAQVITAASAGYVANVSLLASQLGMAGVAIAASPIGLISGLALGAAVGVGVITITKVIRTQLDEYFYNF